MKTKLLLLLLAVFTLSVNSQTQVVTGVNVGTALDYDGNHLYIAELFGNKISRIDLTVGASSYEVVTNVSRPEAVAIDGNSVYTAGIQLAAALVADNSGSLPTTANTIAAGGDIRTVVFDATHGLYLIKTDGSSNSKIYSISGITQTFIVDVGVGDVRAATIEGSEMYLSSRSGGAIYKFDLNNVATPTLVKSGLNQPYEIDIANNHLYYASEAGILGKFDLANTAAAPTIFVNNTLGDLAGIEVMGGDIYFTSWGNNAVYKVNDPDLTPCIVNLPDANFKTYLVANTAINTNGDTEIQCSEASAFTGTILASAKNISDMTGIEAFTALTQLFCTNNSLTTLDVSKNTALNRLSCGGNSLSSIDVSSNLSLENLEVSSNSLSSIDVSNNLSLIILDVSGNQLSNINVAANTQLVALRVGANSINNVNVSSNLSLVALEVYNNQLTALDVSVNTNLVHLYAQNNNLTNLDVSLNTALNYLDVSNNNLTNLDVSLNTALNYLDVSNNNLTDLNVANGNNSNFYDASNGGGSGNPAMDARQNLNLICIQINAGFTPPSTPSSSTRWEKDATASFSTNCGVFLGINNHELKNIEIYPNPVQNQLFIEIDNQEVIEITIIDLSGRVIQSITNINTKSIDVSGLVQGVYMLRVSTKKRVFTKKILKY